MFIILHLIIIRLFLTHQNMLFISIYLFGLWLFYNRNKFIFLLSVFLLLSLFYLSLFSVNPENSFTVLSQKNNYTILKQGLVIVDGFIEESLEVGDVITINKLEKTRYTDPSKLIQGVFFNIESSEVSVMHQHKIISFLDNYLIKDNPLRSLIFRTKVVNNSLLTLLVSTGILFTSIIRHIKNSLRLFLLEIYANKIIIGLIILVIFLFGFRLVFIRSLISYSLKEFKINYKTSLWLEIFIILCLYPMAIGHLAFIFPYGYKLSRYLSEDKTTQKLKQLLFQIFFQLIFLHKFQLFSLILPKIRFITLIIFYLSLFNISIEDNSLITIFNNLNFSFSGAYNLLFSVLIMSVLIFNENKKELLVFSLVVLLLHYGWYHHNPMLQVHYLDVGQGDASVIIEPKHRKVYLIDTGKPSAYYHISKQLNQLGISYIDTLIITHDDLDHSGNIDSLINEFFIDKVITEKGVFNDSLQIVELLPQYIGEDSNDNSLIFYMKFFENSYMFSGDISSSVERKLLEQYVDLKVDVLKLAHHGSKTSSDFFTLHSLNPNLAIISSDPSTYGHPHSDVLNNLAALQIPILTTYNDGLISIYESPWIGVIKTSKWLSLFK